MPVLPSIKSTRSLSLYKSIEELKNIAQQIKGMVDGYRENYQLNIAYILNSDIDFVLENYKSQIDILKEYGIPITPEHIHKLYAEQIFLNIFKQICDIIDDPEATRILAVHAKKISIEVLENCDNYEYIMEIFDKLSYLFKYY